MDNPIDARQAIHDKIDAIMANGDPAMREMLHDLILEFHHQVMSDPKSRAGMKTKMKAFGDNIVKFPFSPEKRVPQKKSKPNPAYLIFSTAMVVFVLFFWFKFGLKHSGAPVRVCNIKGNINPAGEKIYHLPNTTWYEKTFVDESKGEKWFCSEDEARGSGWRAAY